MTPAKLQTIRRLLGWTQERMAKETKYSRGYINNMEKGRQGFEVSQLFVEKLTAAVIDHVKKLQKIVK